MALVISDPWQPLIYAHFLFNAEGIEALANTRVIIRPAGKMAGEAYVDSYKVRSREGRNTVQGSCRFESVLCGTLRACLAGPLPSHQTQLSNPALPLPAFQGGKTQRSFSGCGADEELVVSSARAYIRWTAFRAAYACMCRRSSLQVPFGNQDSCGCPSPASVVGWSSARSSFI